MYRTEKKIFSAPTDLCYTDSILKRTGSEKMKVIDVFECYYEAECIANDRPRHAAKVVLTATSDAGMITYEWTVSFFPHDDEEDFAVSYDAAVSRIVYEGKGRRSKKREPKFLEERESVCDEIATELDGKVFWDRPLREARLG